MPLPGLKVLNFISKAHRGKTPIKNRFEFFVHSVRPVPKDAKDVKLIMIRGTKDKTRRVSELAKVVGDTGDWGEDALRPNNITLYMRENGTFDEKIYNIYVKAATGRGTQTFAKGHIDVAKFATADRNAIISKTLEVNLLKEPGVELVKGSRKTTITLRLTVKCYLREKDTGPSNVMTQITEMASNLRIGPAGVDGEPSGCCCCRRGGGEAAGGDRGRDKVAGGASEHSRGSSRGPLGMQDELAAIDLRL